MAFGLCGKDCAACEKKERLDCPGCKLGPGKPYNGECEIAKCCRLNGHSSCTTCPHSRNYCAKYNTRDGAADFRLEKIQREERRKKIAAERAGVLGASLMVIFWLYIVKNVLGLFSNELLGGLMPVIAIIASIVSASLSIVIAINLIGLDGQDSGYRTAGICYLVTAVMDIAMAVFGGAIEGGLISILISIPSLVAGMFGHYKFYITNSLMLEDVDDEMAEKWTNLWKWYLICCIVTLASLLVTFVIPLFGILLMSVGAVGAFVLSIMELVYLYKSARVFQGYSHVVELIKN